MPLAVTTDRPVIDPTADDLVTPPVALTSALPNIPALAKTSLLAMAVNIALPVIAPDANLADPPEAVTVAKPVIEPVAVRRKPPLAPTIDLPTIDALPCIGPSKAVTIALPRIAADALA
jgi:hypothetical protein